MGTVVLPAIIVAAVGLIAGIILTIAAKLMVRSGGRTRCCY